MNARAPMENFEAFTVNVPEDGFLLSLWKGLIPAPDRATMRDIAKVTAADHGITYEQLLSPSRRRELAYARFDFMWRCRKAKKEGQYYRFSFPQIAKFLGMDCHSSVVHGVRQWEKLLKAEGVSA